MHINIVWGPNTSIHQLYLSDNANQFVRIEHVESGKFSIHSQLHGDEAPVNAHGTHPLPVAILHAFELFGVIVPGATQDFVKQFGDGIFLNTNWHVHG